jgi:hypothetical protein
MFLARRRYLSTTLSAEEANQFDRDNCDAYDFSSEKSRWYLTELSHVRFLYWKVSGWLRLKNNLVRSVRHAGVQVLVLLESGGHPGSGMELYTFFKARPGARPAARERPHRDPECRPDAGRAGERGRAFAGHHHPCFAPIIPR